MDALGLDIGTTTISAVVLRSGVPAAAQTWKNDALLPGAYPWERIQDPRRIWALAQTAVQTLLDRFPDVACIGVTGQMHGIVYLDSGGEPVSPLYTWQDERGGLPYRGGTSYAAYLGGLSGCPLSAGYGMATHFYNLKNGLVPACAAALCTISDYVAMALSGRTTPVADLSNAASLGLFDLPRGGFDGQALHRACIDPALLPEVAQSPGLGRGAFGLPVFTAIGDNQASFLGATGAEMDCALVNVGTGGQISVYSRSYLNCSGLETRPFPKGGYLLVGASLCGGRAYALLENLFRRTAEMVLGQPCAACYGAMDRLLENSPPPSDVPRVLPLFQGTRQSPGLRGSISGLGTENFDPLHLMYGTMYGIADELYHMYERVQTATGGKLFGSGNGLRKNAHLQKIMAERFALPLHMSPNEEEAACGAALFASAALAAEHGSKER